MNTDLEKSVGYLGGCLAYFVLVGVGALVLFILAGFLFPSQEDQPLPYEVVNETEGTVNGASVKTLTANVDNPMVDLADHLSLTAKR